MMYSYFSLIPCSLFKIFQIELRNVNESLCDREALNMTVDTHWREDTAATQHQNIEVYVERIINNNNVRVNPYKMLHCIACLYINAYSFDDREKHNYQKSILFAVKYQLDLKMIKRT